MFLRLCKIYSLALLSFVAVASYYLKDNYEPGEVLKINLALIPIWIMIITWEG